MFRFTIRDALWLTVVVAMGGAIFWERSARENDRQAATRRASDQEMEAVNARYEAAKAEFEERMSWWRKFGSGSYSITAACDAIEHFAHATEEMRDDPELRVKDLASALDAAQVVASSTKDKYEQGVEGPPTLYRTQYTRADIEARLQRAEQELAAARAEK